MNHRIGYIAWLSLLTALLCFAIYKFSDPDYDKTVNDDIDILFGDGSRGDFGAECEKHGIIDVLYCNKGQS